MSYNFFCWARAPPCPPSLLGNSIGDVDGFFAKNSRPFPHFCGALGALFALDLGRVVARAGRSWSRRPRGWGCSPPWCRRCCRRASEKAQVLRVAGRERVVVELVAHVEGRVGLADLEALVGLARSLVGRPRWAGSAGTRPGRPYTALGLRQRGSRSKGASPGGGRARKMG